MFAVCFDRRDIISWIMAIWGKGTADADSPILLTESPTKSPVKILSGDRYRYNIVALAFVLLGASS